MRLFPIVLAASLALGAAGCVQQSNDTTRNARSIAVDSSGLHGQANALTDMTQDIVRKSTVQGAAIGAIAGCGLVALSASNAKNCLAGAAAGGALGAMVGNAQGQKQAERRVNLVSSNALARPVGKAADQIALIEMSLPAMLSAQDIELADMAEQVRKGTLSNEAFAAREKTIKAERAQIAHALSLSARQTMQAHKNLKAAQAQGQTGLEWLINATGHLADDTVSARASLDLL